MSSNNECSELSRLATLEADQRHLVWRANEMLELVHGMQETQSITSEALTKITAMFNNMSQELTDHKQETAKLKVTVISHDRFISMVSGGWAWLFCSIGLACAIGGFIVGVFELFKK